MRAVRLTHERWAGGLAALAAVVVGVVQLRDGIVHLLDTVTYWSGAEQVASGRPLTTRLAPCRQVRLELRRSYPGERFAAYGTVESLQERHVLLLVKREELTRRVSELLDRFEVVDLEVSDPPIEELIGGVFQRAAAQTGASAEQH